MWLTVQQLLAETDPEEKDSDIIGLAVLTLHTLVTYLERIQIIIRATLQSVTIYGQ